MGGVGDDAEEQYRRALAALKGRADEAVEILAAEYEALPEERYLGPVVGGPAPLGPSRPQSRQGLERHRRKQDSTGEVQGVARLLKRHRRGDHQNYRSRWLGQAERRWR